MNQQIQQQQTAQQQNLHQVNQQIQQQLLQQQPCLLVQQQQPQQPQSPQILCSVQQHTGVVQTDHLGFPIQHQSSQYQPQQQQHHHHQPAEVAAAPSQYFVPVEVPVEKLQATAPVSQPIQHSLQFCQQASFEVPQPMYTVYNQYQQPVQQPTFEAQPPVVVYSQPETASYAPQQPTVVQYQQVPAATQPTFEPKATAPVYNQPESAASYVQQQPVVQYQQVQTVQATFEAQSAVSSFNQQPDMTAYVQQQQPVTYQPTLQPPFESQPTLPVYSQPIQQPIQPIVQYQQVQQTTFDSTPQTVLPVYTANPQDVTNYGQQPQLISLSNQTVVGYVPQTVEQQQQNLCPANSDAVAFPVHHQQPLTQTQPAAPQFVQQMVYHPGVPEQLIPQQPQLYSIPSENHHSGPIEAELSVLPNPLIQMVQQATVDYRAATPEPPYQCSGSDVYTTDSCGESSCAETLDFSSATNTASVMAAAASTVTSTALEKRQARRTTNTKRRRTIERGPRLTVISVNGTVIEFQLEAMKQKTVTTFKFDQTDTVPADVAKNLIQAGLLSEEHAEIVIEQVCCHLFFACMYYELLNMTPINSITRWRIFYANFVRTPTDSRLWLYRRQLLPG